MRLATKAATVLALASLVKSQKVRASLTEQADAALALMSEAEKGPMATAVLDSAASEGVDAMRREGWKLGEITQAVSRELRNAKVEPTSKGRGFC